MSHANQCWSLHFMKTCRLRQMVSFSINKYTREAAERPGVRMRTSMCTQATGKCSGSLHKTTTFAMCRQENDVVCRKAMARNLLLTGGGGVKRPYPFGPHAQQKDSKGVRRTTNEAQQSETSEREIVVIFHGSFAPFHAGH
eukprot:1335058-Amphidinium_carterae.1